MLGECGYGDVPLALDGVAHDEAAVGQLRKKRIGVGVVIGQDLVAGDDPDGALTWLPG